MQQKWLWRQAKASILLKHGLTMICSPMLSAIIPDALAQTRRRALPTAQIRRGPSNDQSRVWRATHVSLPIAESLSSSCEKSHTYEKQLHTCGADGAWGCDAHLELTPALPPIEPPGAALRPAELSSFLRYRLQRQNHSWRLFGTRSRYRSREMSWLAGVGILQLHCLAQTRPHRPLIWLDSGHSCGSLPEIEAASDPVALSLDIRVSRPWDPLGLLTIRINMDVEDRWRSRRRRSKVLSLVLPTRGTFLRLQFERSFCYTESPTLLQACAHSAASTRRATLHRKSTVLPVHPRWLVPG